MCMHVWVCTTAGTAAAAIKAFTAAALGTAVCYGATATAAAAADFDTCQRSVVPQCHSKYI